MEDNPPRLLNALRYKGYARLQDNEREFTEYAISQHPEWVEIWYRLFNDYDRLLVEWHAKNSLPIPPYPQVHQLAHHFALATGGIAKVAFDCALAGYYAQSLMMTRQLFEIWMRIEYVKLVPEAAINWFPSVNGNEPRPPSENTVLARLESRGDKDLKAMVKIVKQRTEYLNKASHASEYVFQQTVSDRPRHYLSGANYNLAQCLLTMNDGAAAFGTVLTAMAAFIDASVPLRLSLVALGRSSTDAMRQSAVDLERYRDQLRRNPHWILDSPNE